MEKSDKRFVYADNAATTRVSESVLNAMMPYFREQYGNPSGLHSASAAASKALRQARSDIASALGAKLDEVYFTSGGTEADNWAVKSSAELGRSENRNRIVLSAIEHHAVIRSCEQLSRSGFTLAYIKPDRFGIIEPRAVERTMGDDVCLVSVMLANNEIGTIQNIHEIAKIAHSAGALMHTDAVQAVGNIPIDFAALGADMLSLSGHKIHAPKGIGALLVREGLRLPPFIVGGGQELSRRAGTENIPAIVGLSQAVRDAVSGMDERVRYVKSLRDRLIDGLLKIDKTVLNGDRENRLCGNVNVSIRGIMGESLAILLDMKGICCSSGSACTTGQPDPSHVLKAIGLSDEDAKAALRLTIGEDLSESGIDYIIENVSDLAKKLRQSSALWKLIENE